MAGPPPARKIGPGNCILRNAGAASLGTAIPLRPRQCPRLFQSLLARQRLGP